MTASIIPFPARVVARRTAIETARMLSAEPSPILSRRLRAEKACLEARDRAKSQDAQRIWQNLADWNALHFRTSRLQLEPLPEALVEETPSEQPTGPESFDPGARPLTLVPWILGGLAVAAAIAVTPFDQLPWLFAGGFFVAACALAAFALGELLR